MKKAPPKALFSWGKRNLRVGAAEGCDLLILKIKIKRSQPSAAPTLGHGVI
jgi:hypothetical protein